MDKPQKLFQQLQHIVLRRSDEYRAWLRLFFVSLVTHALLLLGFLYAHSSGIRWQLIVISSFALLITMIVALVMHKILRALETTEIISSRIERKLVESSDLCDDMAYFIVNSKLGRYTSARIILFSFNAVLFSCWGLVFSYFTFQYFRH